MATPESLIPMMAQGAVDREQKVLNALPPEAITDTAQSIQDPHNEQERPLQEGRLKVQQIVESGFADTLFSIAGRPERVEGTSNPFMAQGSFSPHLDRVTIRDEGKQTFPINNKQVLAHELGHRLWTTLRDESFRERFETSVDSVNLERGEELTQQFEGDGDTEKFAEAFRLALNEVRGVASIADQMEQAEEILGSVDLSADDLEEKAQSMVEFLLEQPLFQDEQRRREVGEVRQQTRPAAQDVTAALIGGS